MTHENAKNFYEAIRPAIEKIVTKLMSSTVSSSPATVKSVDNVTRKATVLLAGCNDTSDQYMTLDNYTGCALNVGDTVWVQYWGSLTNAVIAHKSMGDDEVFLSGATEVAASVRVGSTTTGEPGTAALVTNSGNAVEAVLDFVIPAGDTVMLRVNSGYIQWKYSGGDTWTNLVSLEDIKGDRGPQGNVGSTPVIRVGTTLSAEYGTSPSVSLDSASTVEEPIFNFVIPNGKTGAIGAAGKDGTDGEDGVSCTHEWNGTVLTITSASGTSSANLIGPNGPGGTLSTSIVRW